VRDDVRVRTALRPSPVALVALVVIVSTVVRFAAARRFTIPWIAPDEMLYAMLGESLWDTGTLSIRGAPSPYYSLLTPALIGAPLAGRGLDSGIELAQLLQVAVMSSVAVPVFLWCRRLTSDWWALGASVLTVAGPVLVYGGLLMTEALFYTACTWGLFALAAALERPTAARQGLFVAAVTVAAAVRMQALVLLPAFAIAAVLLGVIGRDLRRARPLAPLSAGIVATGAALLVLRLAAPHMLGSDDLLGAYATLGTSAGVDWGVATFVAWHLAAIALASLVIPSVSLLLLAVEAFAGRVESVPVQAYVATATAYLPVLAVQLGVFADGRLDHVSERYLITGVPVLAIGFATWAGSGAPRRRPAVLATGGVLIVLVALTPFGRVVPATAIQDTLSSAVLLRIEGHPALGRLLLVAVVVVAVATVSLTPRRWLPGVLVVLTLALVGGSVEATRVVERLSAAAQKAALGSGDRRWLDRAAIGPVTLLATGDRPWAADAGTVFWNRSITEVLRLPDVQTGVPPAPPIVTVDDDSGVVSTAGNTPLERDLVAVPDTITLDGDDVARLPADGAEAAGIVVWRTAGRVRVASRKIGFLPNGDVTGDVVVIVPGCVRGALEMTLIGKGGDPISVTVNGVHRGTIQAPPGETVTASIPAPRYADGSHMCTFGLHVDRYVGTTRVEFVPRAPT
jgi:hypothetical protein